MKPINPSQRLLLCAMMFLTSCAGSSPSTTQPVGTLESRGWPEPILLWPNGAPGSQGHDSPDVVTIRHDPATAFSPSRTVAILTNIHHPSITPFLPPLDQATGAALIIAPGGGHKHLSIEHEGYDVAKILSEHGIACFVLKYRLSGEPNSPYKIDDSFMDAQRAIRTVRANAGDWNVDPHRIGILGFSAGGQLAMLSATQFEKPIVGSSDAVDFVDCRPDFAALVYPRGLNHPTDILIPQNTPPMFLADVHDDPISVNLATFFDRLQAAGVPAELHIYAAGSEGFGVRQSTLPVANWPSLFIAWLGEENFSH